MVYSSASDAPSRYFPETGCTVDGVFLAFWNHYGVELCGYPLTNRLVENGVPTQYFQRLALEEAPAGQVRVKALGSEVLNLRDGQSAAPTSNTAPTNRLIAPPPFDMAHDTAQLPHHATLRYTTRALHDIRHLIIHHSGVPVTVGPEVIANYHVTDLNWPGIGYHFVIDGEGKVHQTNALTTISYHARQYNTSGVGIVLLGNFTFGVPTPAQIDAAAALCAWLSQELGLSREAIKGHRELVAVTCPGEQWLQGAAWKVDLLRRVDRIIHGEPEPVVESVPVMAEAESVQAAEARPTLVAADANVIPAQASAPAQPVSAPPSDDTDVIPVQASAPLEVVPAQVSPTADDIPAPPSIWAAPPETSHDAAPPQSAPSQAAREPVTPLPPTDGTTGDNT